MNSTPETTRETHETDEDLAAQAANWAIADDAEDMSSEERRRLIAWLSRSPRHMRAYLLVTATATGIRALKAENMAADEGAVELSWTTSVVSRWLSIHTVKAFLAVAFARFGRAASATFARNRVWKVTKGVPHFLSQAVHDDLLTPQQALEILQVQQKERRMTKMSRLAGEIAASLGYLTQDQREEVELHRRQARALAQAQLDPVNIGGRRLAFAIQSIVAIVAIVVMCRSLPDDRSNTLALSVGSLGIVAFTASFVATLIPRSLIREIRQPLAFHIFSNVRTVSILSGPATVATFLFLSWQIAEATNEIGVSARSSRALVVLSILLLASTLIVAASAAFQSRVKDYFTWRDDELSRVEYRFLRFTREPREERAGSLRNDLIGTSARLLSQNPWLRLCRRSLFVFGGPAVASIWYLRPDRNNRRFDILSITRGGAPEQVCRALKRFMENHHPAFLNEQKYQEALDRCRGRNGEVDVRKFFSIPDRHTFVSLAGIVSVRHRPYYQRDIHECLPLNSSYTQMLDGEPLERASKAWLDFRSVAAYPVMPTSGSREHSDVLIAFSNVPNGFTDADLAMLRKVSKLLGVILPAEENINALSAIPVERSTVHRRDAYSGRQVSLLEPPNFVSNLLIPFFKFTRARHGLERAGSV